MSKSAQSESREDVLEAAEKSLKGHMPIAPAHSSFVTRNWSLERKVFLLAILVQIAYAVGYYGNEIKHVVGR